MNATAPHTVALFPLTAHILPSGRLSLRIFEPRYLRMIKESIAAQQDFGICMLDTAGNEHNNTHILPIGTLVKVIDFEPRADNMLGITVEGIQLFRIQHIYTATDGLRSAEVELLEGWPASPIQPQDRLLPQRLQEVYDAYPELAEMYPDKKLDDAVWVCQRWLEILPLEAQQKQALLASNPLPVTRDFIYQLLT